MLLACTNTRLLAPFVATVATLLAASALFCVGFFPSKTSIAGAAQFETALETQLHAQPAFTRLVVVVVDALRSDFAFGNTSAFDFVHSRLATGDAWGFTAHANPPTVTLPRLKGITTGTTPSFVDAIFNVADNSGNGDDALMDSWPRQLRSHGARIRFYGDDTWLKLFPGDFFDEYDGTSSFFVSDFEEVDRNVSRHLPDLLDSQHAWDVAILHYLGLDHIGHKGGSESQFMRPKQREMDEVVRQIYENVDEETLIILMGDHGMTNGGNHGGSSSSETSAACLMMSPKLHKYERPRAQPANLRFPITEVDLDYQYLTKIQQVDLVPTIAALFNVPIPLNSVGIIIPEFQSLLDDNLFDAKLMDNFKQLWRLAHGQEPIPNLNITSVLPVMKELQSELMKVAAEYDYKFLNLGIACMLSTSLIAIYFTLKELQGNISTLALALFISFTIGTSSFASSYVEEEHQLWWWILIFVINISVYYHRGYNISLHIVLLVCARLVKSWNNSGQKYVYEDVISKLLTKDHPELQWYLNLATLMIVGLPRTTSNFMDFMFSFVLSMSCFHYKVLWSLVNKDDIPSNMANIALQFAGYYSRDTVDIEDIQLVSLARFFFTCFACTLCARIALGKILNYKTPTYNDVVRYINIFLIFDTSPQNIPLFLVFHVMKLCILNLMQQSDYDQDPFLASLISLILQHFSFFQFGGTNSINTVNLSNAYHGVSGDYNIHLVGLQMCISNFAPAIYWFMLPMILPIRQHLDFKRLIQTKLCMLLFYSITGLCLLSACMALRYHLFVWSVFSPKLCYYIAWVGIQFVVLGVIPETLLLTLS